MLREKSDYSSILCSDCSNFYLLNYCDDFLNSPLFQNIPHELIIDIFTYIGDKFYLQKRLSYFSKYIHNMISHNDVLQRKLCELGVCKCKNFIHLNDEMINIMRTNNEESRKYHSILFHYENLTHRKLRKLRDLFAANLASHIHTLKITHCVLSIDKLRTICNIIPHSGIRLLQLTRVNLNDDGLAILCHALMQNYADSNIRSLNISMNTFYDLQPLTDVLCNNYKINELILNGNYMHDKNAAIISTILRRNTHLSSLYLNDCTLSEQGYISILEALEENQHIRAIHLDYNIITLRIAQIFARVLRNNAILAELYCNNAEIVDDVFAELLRELRHNRGLKILSIGDNEITNWSIRELCDILRIKIDDWIECLDIHGNRLNEDSMRSISAMLEFNRGLKELNISCCPEIGLSGFEILARGLKVNRGLNVLEIQHSDVFLEDKDKIFSLLEDILKENQTLVSVNCEDYRDQNVIEYNLLKKNRDRMNFHNIVKKDNL